MNELIIRHNKKTHKPKYIGIATPMKNSNTKRLKTLHGNISAISTPINIKDCDTCELYLTGKCDPDKTLELNKCPFPPEEEKQ